ncbi:MAG: hypothetical protein KGL39_55760 [Patescibacteria group bacterium]|nr:hypothetical protein [Patescibacteria group bacterium]
MHVTPIEEAAKQAEEAIGNNLVFLTDCLALCKAGAHKVGLEMQTPIHNYAR